MSKPKRTFSADVGQSSTGSRGPDQIEIDLDALFNMLDPTQDSGGIGSENLQNDSVTDLIIGIRTLDDAIVVPVNQGQLTALLSSIVNRIKGITGKSSWLIDPTHNIDDIASIADTANSNASVAVTTANDALSAAGDAVNTANTASTNATSAVSIANTANTTATEVQTDYNTQKPIILQAVADANEAVEAVASKADVSYVDQVAANFTMGVIADGSLGKVKLDASLQNEIDTKAVASDLIYQVAGGTATALTLTLPVLVDGYAKTFIALANNNGAATTINTKPLYKPNTTTAPTLIAGKAYTAWYNAAGECFFIKASAEGTAVASDVLAGETFSNDHDTGLTGTLALTGTALPSQALAGATFYTTDPKIKQTGTIPSKGAATITPRTTNQTIAAGQYLSGAQTILGDADLASANILSGKNIFGVAGSVIPAGLNPGDNIWVDLQNGSYTKSASYTKLKEVKINMTGSVRVKFAIRATGATVYGRIYKNGSPYGIERSTISSTMVTFTEDISVNANDLIQLYVHSNGLDNLYYDYFRLCTGSPIPSADVILDI